MGGKSRKTGSISRKLVERLQSQSSKGGKSSSKTGVTKGGLLEKGGHKWMEDFPGDEERKKREAEGGGQ